MQGNNDFMQAECDGWAFNDRRIAIAETSRVTLPQYLVPRNDVNPHDQRYPLHIPLTTEVIGCMPRERPINNSIERRRLTNPPEEEEGRNGTFPTNGRTGGGVYGK